MEKRGKKVKTLTPQDVRSRERKRIKRRIVSLLLFSLAFFALFFLLFVYLVSLPKINIQKVEIEGAQVVSSEEISLVVFEELSSKSLGFFPNSSVLFVPRQKIESSLRENFLRIRGASVEIDNLQTLVVKIEERQPQAIWCRDAEVFSLDEDGVLGKSTTDKTQEECYFIDDASLIFARAPNFSPGVFLRFESEPEVEPERILKDGIASTSFPLGKQVLDSSLFVNLLDFVEHLSNIDILVEKVNLSAGQEISLETSGASQILLDKKQDLTLAATNIFAIVEDEKFQDDIGGNFSNIDYLDMKIPGKVFYSIKNSD